MFNDQKFITAAIAFVLIVVAIFIFFKKKPNMSDYDERQSIVRGKAYRAGFLTLLASTPLFACFYESQQLFTVAGGIFTCCGLSLLIFGCICVKGDAFIAMREDNRRAIACAVIGIADAFLGAEKLLDGSAFTDGRLNERSAILTLGVVVAVMGILQLIRNRALKNSGDESEDE